MTLSRGIHHRQVPKDIRANVRWRGELLRACESRAFQQGVMEVCRHDLMFWINAFVWQVDPKQRGEKGTQGPFVTYEFQDAALMKMLGWVEKGRDGLIEKSRQMGASWMLLMLFDWLFLFHRGQTFLFISRSEAAVEDPSPNSLFWKLDYIHRHLPDWMLPGGVREGLRRRKRYFGNDVDRSAIFGEASTGQANVGGNTTAMGIDEFSQIKEDREVFDRTSDATYCRIFNGTHKGVGTAFFDLTALAKKGMFNRIVMHWSEHPLYRVGLYKAEAGRVKLLDDFHGTVELGDKSYAFPEHYPFNLSGKPAGGPFPGLRSPFYDDQCLRKGSSRAVAMDLDIDPAGSEEQFFDALTIRELQDHYCRPPLWVGDLEVDPDLAYPKKLVARDGGPLELWIHPTPEGRMPVGVYVVGADLSSGQGKTPSVLSVVNENGQKVGQYATNQKDPISLGAYGVGLCWLFKGADGMGAKLVWEVPGPGLAFGKEVVRLGYRRIYYRENIDQLTPLPSDIPGWVSNQRTKLLLLQEYRDALTRREFNNPSWEAMQECYAFVYDDEGNVVHSAEQARGSPADARQNHGDHVIADALAHMLRKGRGPRVQVVKEQLWHPGCLEGRRRLAELERRQEDEEWV